MVFTVKRILNKPVSSNCYIVYNSINLECLIIDPGSEDNSDIELFVSSYKLKPIYIMLSHCHFDHIWGVDRIAKKYECEIICSNITRNALRDSKSNLSFYYNQKGFEVITNKFIIVSDNKSIYWNGELISFIETPGHSKGSICIMFMNFIFTGDSLINKLKTVTKLPGGSKKDLLLSIEKIKYKVDEKTIFFGGHESKFSFEDFNDIIIINN